MITVRSARQFKNDRVKCLCKTWQQLSVGSDKKSPPLTEEKEKYNKNGKFIVDFVNC